MSTVKANNYYDASGGSNAQLYGVASPPNSMGFRNRLINGDMRIDQRNAGASVTLTSANGVYAVDRFESYANIDGTVTAQRVTDAPAGFTNSLRHTTTVADTSLSATQRVQLVQKIEGFNVADFGLGTTNAVTFTVSFWVKSSLTGTFGGGMVNGSYTRSYPFTYTINSANTWEYKTVTIAGDISGTWLTDNQRGLILTFGLGVGSQFVGTANTWQTGEVLSPSGCVSLAGTLNATWQITGVQLEAGTVASPFERRDYGRELIMCQRYYEVGGNGAVGAFNSTTTAWVSWVYKVTKRAAATTGFVANASLQDPGNATFTGTSWGSVQNNTVSAVTGLFGGFSGATQNRVCISGGDSIYASAEL